MTRHAAPRERSRGTRSGGYRLRVRLAAVGVAGLGLAALPGPGSAQGFPGGAGGPGGFGGGQEQAILERFDADGNGYLDAPERSAARAFLSTQQPVGRGPGGRGGPVMIPMPPDGAAPPTGPDGPVTMPFPGPGPGAPGAPGAAPAGADVFGGPGAPGGMRGGRGGAGGGFGGFRGVVPGSPGIQLTAAEVKTYPASTPLYDPGALRTIFLTFENQDWEQELAAFRYTDVDVPAVALVDGQTYSEVGASFRGASSYMMIPEGNKRSLKLSFDLVHDGQNLGGYRTLNLLNVNGDPTFVRAVLYSQIARGFIAAPRINYVRVVVNGENWGVYLNAQQFNRDFLNDFFPASSGARWKVPGSPGGRGGLEYLGDDVAAYRRIYEIKTRDDDERWTDLIELTRVLNATPPEQLEAALAPILDIDGALKFLALDVALVNSDGYWTRASDYNIYQDRDGRFHVIPHDINEALSGNTRLDPLVGLQDATKPLRSRLLAVPALRERYMGYVREIAEQLDWNRIGPMVEQYQALIEEDVMRDTRKLYASEAFRSDVANLRGFLEARREFLLR
jgi:hypothetical protein